MKCTKCIKLYRTTTAATTKANEYELGSNNKHLIIVGFYKRTGSFVFAFFIFIEECVVYDLIIHRISIHINIRRILWICS